MGWHTHRPSSTDKNKNKNKNKNENKNKNKKQQKQRQARPIRPPTTLESPWLLSHRALWEHVGLLYPMPGFDKGKGHPPGLYFHATQSPYLILNSNKIFKPLPRKSSLNHLFFFISIPVIKENHISEIFSCTYQNPPSNQSISITITTVPCCCRY